MAHAHDSTMLARFGFQDPDRKVPEHDLACRYVAQEDVQRAVLRACSSPDLPCDADNIALETVRLEWPVTKGNGQYMTTVGFADVVLPWSGMGSLALALIEVKVTPVSVAEALRQINLYRAHMVVDNGQRPPWQRWLPAVRYFVLATTYPLSEDDVAVLKAADVVHVFLGERFRAWAAAQQERQARVAASAEV